MFTPDPDRPHLSEHTRGVMLESARELGRQIGEDAPRLKTDLAERIGRTPSFAEIQRVAEAMMQDTMARISAYVIDEGGTVGDAEAVCQALHDAIRDTVVGTRH